jgi:hypothetical protein
LLPVEATLPPLEPEAKLVTDSPGAAKRQAPRRSREELHEDVQGQARLTAVFVMMAGLSAVVAGIGLARDDAEVITGAMVIARADCWPGCWVRRPMPPFIRSN